MRIGCLQFAPQVADVDNNLNKADAILSEADPRDLDLLVLPELAFSGYNFNSLGHISPFLEESNSGISSLWARTTALKHDCTVLVGYPEKVDPTINWPTSPEYYNSAIVVNGEGETVANYRKTHLYYTDESWALEGSHGFFQGRLPGLGRTAIGICMDLNPYKFEAPWDRFEFAQHALDCGARLVIVSMAWITNDDPRTFNNIPQEPDTDTLLYWVSRLEPIIRIESNQEVIVVFANRCGAEGEVTYAGTSAVIGIRSGEVWVYDILGRGETDLLVVDTDSPPYAKLAYRPDRRSVGVEDQGSSDVDADVGDNKHVPKSNQSQEDRQSVPPTSTTQQPRGPDVSASRQRAKTNYDHGREHHRFGGPRNGQGGNENAIVHTPSAPSLTTDPARPRHEIPPHQYMLQRYLESESPISRHDPLGSTIQASIGALTLSDSVAPSRISKPSTDASQSTTAPEETRWFLQDGRDDLPRPHGESMVIGDEKRHSLRSDVSVWNNQPGRAPDIAVLMTAPPELSYRNAQETPNLIEGGVGTTVRGGQKSKSRLRSRQRSNHRRGTDYELPMSSQASQSLLGKKKSQGQNDGIERSFSSNAVLQSDSLRSSTAPKPSAEEVGRGRRRSAQRQSRERRQRSHSGQVPRPEPIDLSQFALIEEYPSPHCPVHGSRPPSGTRHRNQSGVRGRSENSSRLLPENGGGRQPSRNTWRAESRKANPDAKLSQRHDKGSETVATMTPGYEPKTPIAMLLVHDLEPAKESPGRMVSALTCVERNREHVIARPMGSVW